MGIASYIQSSFLGGEWSKAAQGRIDRPDYRTALNLCLNGIPMDSGAWTRRSGFRYMAHTRNGAAGRVIPWTFKEAQPYDMEFTDGYLRFIDDSGLVKTNDAQTVVSISTANPAKVATTTAHGWSTGNQGMFGNLAGATPLLLNRQVKITVTSATEFTIADALTGTAINGSTLGANPTAATFSRITEIATPYTATTWQRVRSVQTEKTAVLLNGATPQALTVTKDPTTAAFAEFALTEPSFIDGPYYDPVPGGTQITPDALTGIVNLTTTYPTWSATKAYSAGDFVTYSSVDYYALTGANVNLQPDTHASNWAVVSPGVTPGSINFTGSDIGRFIRLYSEPADWAVGTTYAAAAVVKYNNAYWTALVGSNTGNQSGIDLTKWAVNAAGAIWSWGKITGLRNLINAALAGSASIGQLIEGGGLAALFDSNTDKTYALSATLIVDTGGGDPAAVYAGKNYSGATDQKIQSATLFPPSDVPFVYGTITSGPDSGTHPSYDVTFNLRGKATLPASASDGTLLGSTLKSITLSDPIIPITISSSDQTTAWKYAWVEIVAVRTSGPSGFNVRTFFGVAQMQFFKPAAGAANGVTFQIVGENLLYTVPIRIWRLGLFSDTTGYPTCGTYHEGRLWLSGIVDNRIDGGAVVTRSGTMFDFTPTEKNGVVTDANAISYVFSAPGVNPIFWMLSEQQGIICGTQAGEWLVRGSESDNKITPTSIRAHQVTHIGCANIEPRKAGLTMAFVQKFKHKIMEYFADVYSGKYASPNLSLMAKHLATRGLEEIAYQQELVPILWNRCTDGSLIGATYKRESLSASQGPAFIGWHQHTLGSGRTIESICAGPSDDGLLDALTIVSNDTATGIRHVERLTNLFEEGSDISAGWFLDDAITPAYAVATVAGRASLVLTGLWHLNGSTVTVSAGGIDCGAFAVASGTCTVPLTGLLTQAYIDTFDSGAFPVVVGFSYTSKGQIVRPATQPESGARTGPGFGKVRRTHLLSALLQDTQGISFGTDFAKLNAANFETPGGTAYTRLELFSGVFRVTPTDSYGLDSMVAWQISRPYPATVALIGGMLETQDQ